MRDEIDTRPHELSPQQEEELDLARDYQAWLAFERMEKHDMSVMLDWLSQMGMLDKYVEMLEARACRVRVP